MVSSEFFIFGVLLSMGAILMWLTAIPTKNEVVPQLVPLFLLLVGLGCTFYGAGAFS